MTASAWIALGTFALCQSAAVVIWGTMVEMRIRAAESALQDLKGIDSRLVRIESSIEGVEREFRMFRESVEWMRQPAGYSHERAK